MPSTVTNFTATISDSFSEQRCFGATIFFPTATFFFLESNEFEMQRRYLTVKNKGLLMVTNLFTVTNLIHGDDFLTVATSVAREVGGAQVRGLD